MLGIPKRCRGISFGTAVADRGLAGHWTEASSSQPPDTRQQQSMSVLSIQWSRINDGKHISVHIRCHHGILSLYEVSCHVNWVDSFMQGAPAIPGAETPLRRKKSFSLLPHQNLGAKTMSGFDVISKGTSHGHARVEWQNSHHRLQGNVIDRTHGSASVRGTRERWATMSLTASVIC